MDVTLTGLDGRVYDVRVGADEALKDAALRERVPGVIGECGGFAICGTCHVYVDDAHAAALPDRSAREENVLEGSLTELRPTSRLSCQLHGHDLPEGMTAEVADTSWYL